jgi:hypothetical protein
VKPGERMLANETVDNLRHFVKYAEGLEGDERLVPNYSIADC